MAVQLGGPHSAVLVIGHPVDVQIDVRALGLVEGVVVFPVLGPRHGLGVPKAVGDGDGLLVILDAVCCSIVRVGLVVPGDAHGELAHQGFEVVIIIVIIF